MATKIICFGDSNTLGNGTEAAPYPNRYSNVLQTLLTTDRHSAVVTNAGHSGKSSETLLAYINAMANEHFDIVTMMIGTNDVNFFYTDGNTPAQAAARHRVAVDALIAAIRTRFTPDFIGWIIPITPAWGCGFAGLPPWTDLMEPTYDAIVAEAVDFCEDNKYNKLGCIRGDLCIKGNAADCPDIHLSVAGAAKLARYIRDRITLHLNE